MSKSMRRRIGDALTPAARAWVRYAPTSLGKHWLWQTFHWRERPFTCRTAFGGMITGNTQDLIQRHLYFFGTWEPSISAFISATLKPGDGFVDIGANIGHYTLLASNCVGADGTVVAIEAAQWIHTILDRHVALNGRRNVRTVQAAAADARGTIKLYPGKPGNIGKTTTVGDVAPSAGAAAIDVPALPLSEILSPDEVRRARIIKIDVEGGELQVLRGLAPLLPQLREDAEIVMEVSTSMPGAERARDEIFAIMQRNGFMPYVLDNDYGVESYLQRAHRKPTALADTRISAQTDVLFSRAHY